MKENQKHKRLVIQLYNKKLDEKVINNHNSIEINRDKLLEFIAYIKSEPNRTASFCNIFFIQHEILRNITRKWKTSDIGDLEHTSVIPYVDALVLDTKMDTFVKQAIKKYPRYLNSKNCLIVDKISKLESS